MQGKLIAELRARLIPKEWVKDNQYRAGYRKCLEETLGLISRHEAEQGEGLREAIAKYADDLYDSATEKWNNTISDELAAICRAHFTPTKPTEPLAVLADSKGYAYTVWRQNFGKRLWVLELYGHSHQTLIPTRNIDESTYQEAESKARKYLNELEDRE